MRRFLITSAALLSMITVFMAATLVAQDGQQDGLTLRITNLTNGQTFSPPVVILHDRNFSLFTLGNAASDGLAALAEDGITNELADAARGANGVSNVIVGDAPIPPGESVEITLPGGANANLISLAGMLTTTNDGFFAVNGEKIPVQNALDGNNTSDNGNGETRILSVAYDAGSEVNNENCGFIPGPPCNNADMRGPEGAEGYVYVHSGVHGTGDLEPAEFDWRNPVALITMARQAANGNAPSPPGNGNEPGPEPGPPIVPPLLGK